MYTSLACQEVANDSYLCKELLITNAVLMEHVSTCGAMAPTT